MMSVLVHAAQGHPRVPQVLERLGQRSPNDYFHRLDDLFISVMDVFAKRGADRAID